MDTFLVLIFQLVVLLFSVVIHEVSHGLMAFRLGDPTAKLAGRLTLNPVKHLDFFGSFLVPLMVFLASQGTAVFGWAKPVPYNPVFLRDPRRGGGLIAAAGPLSNVMIAVIFGIILRALDATGAGSMVLTFFLEMVILINILLAVFNLVPIPPLDGSKVLFALLPDSPEVRRAVGILESYGFFILLIFIFFGWRYLFPIIEILFNFIRG